MDDDEARAILREHGQEPPARGKLAQHWREAAESLRQDGPAPGPDYDGGVTDADFVTTADLPPEPPVIPERKPRRRTRVSTPSIRDRLKGKPKPKGRPKHPRVPVDRVVGMVWEAFGRMFTPVSPPTGRCLRLQAPVAGLILEDVVKGTMVDRALQPIARAEEKGKKVLALAGPPACVLALEMAANLPEEQRQLRAAFLMPMLIESLMLWDDVAGDKLEAQMERERRDGPRRERAEQLAAMIFGAVPGTAEPADDGVAAAQQMAGV